MTNIYLSMMKKGRGSSTKCIKIACTCSLFIKALILFQCLSKHYGVQSMEFRVLTTPKLYYHRKASDQFPSHTTFFSLLCTYWHPSMFCTVYTVKSGWWWWPGKGATFTVDHKILGAHEYSYSNFQHLCNTVHNSTRPQLGSYTREYGFTILQST